METIPSKSGRPNLPGNKIHICWMLCDLFCLLGLHNLWDYPNSSNEPIGEVRIDANGKEYAFWYNNGVTMQCVCCKANKVLFKR